jgi:hypothetical protein
MHHNADMRMLFLLLMALSLFHLSIPAERPVSAAPSDITHEGYS